ncbi:ATP-dependent DNA helicase RecG [Citricoccus sp.]|uniref:ATP-dependent DNA helicase RecG n=1 Tax=Micrococcaceae TaxID=1268 RepID=UPI0016217625|nr:ATP-dependent DNA helicase RecG [Citricoccus sp.]MBB5748443.1 ATP-dependent DNA helicase RecG [Micrococcus sp. TA1]HRO93624.1 ATP-dependent DNA helicase RecG [Citricoccus sp.]
MSPDPLDQPLERLLGGKTAQRLERELGLRTARDLLEHFPRRWIERGEMTAIASLPVGEQVTVVARVVSASRRPMHSRRGFIVDVTVTDDDTSRPASLDMAFFNGYDAQRRLKPGLRAMFHGKTALYRGELTLNNPDFSVLDDSEQPDREDLAPVPLYPATAKVPSWVLRSSVSTVLDALDWAGVEDPVPAALLEDAADDGVPLPSLAQAYRDIHRPVEVRDAHRARRRFALHEALVLQGALAVRRHASAAHRAVARPAVEEGLRSALDRRLPFTLTAGQVSAGQVLSADLSRDHPMSRLLQGEVGSGKTLVALRAMLQVVDAGGQAALVAPTEVLAVQHHRSLVSVLGPLGRAGRLDAPDGPATEVVLLTGSMPAAARREALLKIASGQAGLVVGTHALFSGTVQFADLGLAVVDEQHRFGVDQREALRRANPGTHLLVMSATPIPRSVAMTVFGDLDLTVLPGLPSGRQPVATHVARMAHGPRIIARVWEVIAEQVAAGHQAFVVCPKIDPTDAGAADEADGDGGAAASRDRRHDAAVEDMVPRLRELPALRGARIAGLHGRQDQQAQAEAMGRFVAGEVDVLVATTVIEVGVDVPNATVMAILDADAFGLSTLHQLRGRVGRGTAPSICLLATRLPDGHPAVERLEVVAGTQDGLEIARADVMQRGEGDILGAAQHGGSRLKVLKVLRHADLIDLAAGWIEDHQGPDGTLEGHPALAAAVAAWEAGHVGSGDYLEKG